MQAINTIALELVPTSADGGDALAREQARNIRALLESSGLADRINTVVVPQIIPEDGDRPAVLEEKMDQLDYREIVFQELPASFILTQVTVLTPLHELKAQVQRIRQAGVERVVFVGAPRGTRGRPTMGRSTSEALTIFRDLIPSRGAILIPTRPGEEERFRQKLESGATFALTQLLFSDQIVNFLHRLRHDPHKPEIILSFGYVPRLELKVGLIRWLIRDTTPFVRQEMEYVAELARLPFKEKKARFVELYKRVVDGASKLGFPLGLQFECPYRVSEPALETFSAMLEAYPFD